MDFHKLLQQFQTPESLEFLNLVRTWQTSPDEYFYEIETNDGVYYIFEVDYIESLDSVIAAIKKEIGEFTQLCEVKSMLAFEDAEPVKLAKIYYKPEGWETVSKYANDKYGSYPFYFNFLIKK